jgi:hypothetical protein
VGRLIPWCSLQQDTERRFAVCYRGGAEGPVGVPPDPAAVLAPGAGEFVGPVEVPPAPAALLRPKPGDVLPAAPGTPAGAAHRAGCCSTRAGATYLRRCYGGAPGQ